MSIYFITERGSETGLKFKRIEEKAERIRLQGIALSKEIGFEQWRGGFWTVFGGFSALIFNEVPDPKVYKRVNGNEWMPKKNCKEGRAILERLNSSETIEKHELNMCIGFDGAPFSTIGFAMSNPDYFGFILSPKWNCTPPIDCEEVTYSRYQQLFNSEPKKDQEI